MTCYRVGGLGWEREVSVLSAKAVVFIFNLEGGGVSCKKPG